MPVEDARGHLHADAGSPEGGQFTNKPGANARRHVIVDEDGNEEEVFSPFDDSSNNAFGSNFSQWAKDRGPIASESSGSYMGDGYKRINPGMRRGKDLGIYQSDVDGMKRDLVTSKFNQDTVLYRGVTLPGAVDYKSWEGKTVSQKGFTSTTVSPGQAAYFSSVGDNPSIMRIRAHAGSSALRGDSTNAEFILKDDAKLRITKVKKVDFKLPAYTQKNITWIEAEYR